MKQALIAAAVALAFGGPALAANDSHDHGHGAQDTRLELNQGKKWQTDEALRQGMENIRAALKANKDVFLGREQSAEKYAPFAAKVNSEVANIVKNCKLEPQADAQLHKVIGHMMSGVEAMEGKEKGVSPLAGASRVGQALNEYGRYFDHPGWKKL